MWVAFGPAAGWAPAAADNAKAAAMAAMITTPIRSVLVRFILLHLLGFRCAHSGGGDQGTNRGDIRYRFSYLPQSYCRWRTTPNRPQRGRTAGCWAR